MDREKFLTEWEALYPSVINSWEPHYYGDLPIPPPTGNRDGWQGFWSAVEKQPVQRERKQERKHD